MRDAPERAYVTKHLVGTPTKVDSVEADPVCPYCNEPADNEIDETTFFCSVKCPASCEADHFEPIVQVTSSYRFDFDGARKLRKCAIVSAIVYVANQNSQTKPSSSFR